MKLLKAYFISLLFITPMLASGQASSYSVHNTVASNGLASDCEVGPSEELDQGNCKIISYIVTGINLLTAVAGIAIVASIMIAGLQYMTARDNSGQIEAARKRIVWALIALLTLIVMYAGLNFLVPGGVL